MTNFKIDFGVENTVGELLLLALSASNPVEMIYLNDFLLFFQIQDNPSYCLNKIPKRLSFFNSPTPNFDCFETYTT